MRGCHRTPDCLQFQLRETICEVEASGSEGSGTEGFGLEVGLLLASRGCSLTTTAEAEEIPSFWLWVIRRRSLAAKFPMRSAGIVIEISNHLPGFCLVLLIHLIHLTPLARFSQSPYQLNKFTLLHITDVRTISLKPSRYTVRAAGGSGA